MLQDHGKAPHECSSTYLDIVPRHQEARRWKTLLFIHTQVSPHTSAHVQRRAFQHRVRAAFQWRGPADDHHLGEHRLRGHREPGAHLQERHHQRLVALAALSTCCLNGFSPWSLDLHWHNFGFSLTYSSHSDGLFSCAFILCWTRACVLRSLRSLIVILQSDFQSGLFFFSFSVSVKLLFLEKARLNLCRWCGVSPLKPFWLSLPGINVFHCYFMRQVSCSLWVCYYWFSLTLRVKSTLEGLYCDTLFWDSWFLPLFLTCSIIGVITVQRKGPLQAIKGAPRLS